MDKKIDKIQDAPEEKKDDLLTQKYGDNKTVNQSEESEDFDEPKANTKLFILLALAAFIILGFLLWYNNSQFKKTVAVDVPDWVLDSLDTKTEEEQLAELKDKDTDRDGLTDYQELYQYGTSIFLADTDSDGYTDHEEVIEGYDALCPAGQNCNLLRLITPKTKLSEVIQEVNDSELTIEEAVLAEFKIFLLENGFSQEDLDLMTDEELLEILSVMSEVTTSDIDNSSTTPGQVRDFLLSQPDADEEVINSLTDEELMLIQEQLSNK